MLMIDNGALACITNDPADFVQKPTTAQVSVTGISGDTEATLKGTVIWKLETDDGSKQKFKLDGCYYIPGLTWILSPQHMAQQVSNHTPLWDGTRLETPSNTVVLFSAQRKYKTTVKLSKKTNVGMTRTAPGIKLYFGDTNNCQEKRIPVVFEANVIEDNEPGDASFQSPDLEKTDGTCAAMPNSEGGMILQTKPELQTLDFGEHFNVIHPDDDDEPYSIQPKDELLLWHYCLSHASFKCMKRMMECGLLPNQLLNVKDSLCAACQNGRMHRRPWRDKGKVTYVLDNKLQSQQSLNKWNPRLDIHGRQQDYGVNYWFTYLPIVHWKTLRMMFILSIFKGWCNRHVDSVFVEL
jgi:hypothetical protein